MTGPKIVLELKLSCTQPFFGKSFWTQNALENGVWLWRWPNLSLSFFLFLCRLLFSKKKCLDLKTYLAKVDWRAQKPLGTPLSRPCWTYWGPLVAILDFWGSQRRNDKIKNLFSESCWLISEPLGHFALSRWWGVTCSLALQAMSEWPLRRLAGF